MGTDIHGVWQRRKQGSICWDDIPSNYEQRRHYQLFAVLAGVRNGYGFAGVRTGEPVKPIAEQRGLPDDFVRCDNDDEQHPIASLDIIDPVRREWHQPDEPMEIWMGDHSHSWLTAAEMLAWFDSAPGVVKTGILDRHEYEQWDRKSAPDSYCGGVSGPSVVLVNDNAIERESDPNWTHIRCTWESLLREELEYFFDEVKRLQNEHGEVRFVFGFDS